jgi:integrase/recombinase XerD
MTFEKTVQDFQEYLEACHYSERTVETYGVYVKRFIAFLNTHYPRIRSFDRITKNEVLDFQRYLAQYRDRNGQSLSNSTQSLILRAVRKLFVFLIKKDLILKDPSTAITYPREEQRLTRNILTENEVFHLLENTKPRGPIGIRNRSILELFYSCGIRTSELCNLKVQDVDLKEQTVTVVKGKGGKSRVLPIGQYATHYLQLYLDKARKYMLRGRRQDPGTLFLSQRGNPFNKTTINKTVIRSVARNAKLKKPISAYSFRHSTASHLLAHKVDIMYISKLLGHASLNTTQKYLKVEIGDLKKMHSLYHPRETRRVYPADSETD